MFEFSSPFALFLKVSVSLTLDPKKIAGAPDDELSQVQSDLDKMAAVSFRKGLAIVSLICNVQKTSEILMRVSLLCSGHRIHYKPLSPHLHIPALYVLCYI